MKDQTGKERRSSSRVQVSLHLHLVYNDLEHLVEHYSSNISEGGIFIETNDPLPIGSIVRLKISLVHQDIAYIEAKGEVVHIIDKGSAEHEPGMGVRFIEITSEGQKFLSEFVISTTDEMPKGSKPAGKPKSSAEKKVPGKKKAKKQTKKKPRHGVDTKKKKK